MTDVLLVLHEEAVSTAGEMGLRRTDVGVEADGAVRAYLAPNRGLVVARQSADVFSGQVSSDVDIDVVEPAEPGGYISGSASSQVGPAKYRETRVLRPAELRARAQEAYKRAERYRETLTNGDTQG